MANPNVFWGFEDRNGDCLTLGTPPNLFDKDAIRSVTQYFEALMKHLEECPENYGPFASPDCIMIKPTGGYMKNEGQCSREAMSKCFLTWLAPQKLWSIDNIRLIGDAKEAAVCQIRMHQHFKFKDSEEDDVAVFSFTLEKCKEGSNEHADWRAVCIHRAIGAAADQNAAGADQHGREYKVHLPFAPPADLSRIRLREGLCDR
eukprot:TRINITY_DN39095_c0_g1_i1.p1 TRINITY_DN39095_c0_g1~~TRINITY_DN39095_c0_g1_i1.p1  ORF type:complete len:230 (-),score=35.42 TRINITY_DN39095_c0_g1_i1:112-720(-)